LGTKHRLYGELKRKRHLYLTDTAYEHLVNLARATDASPSQACEGLVRMHLVLTKGTSPLT
jgi:hypothetical protein